MIALSRFTLTLRAVLELFHLGGAGRVGEAGRAPLDHAASARALPLACQYNAFMNASSMHPSSDLTRVSAGVAPLPGAVAPDALPVAAVPVVAAAGLDNGHCLQ